MNDIDEETESIEHLDFTPPCDVSPETGAEFHVQCRACKAGILLCCVHFSWWKRRLKRWEAKHAAIVCEACDHRSLTFEDACEVTPL